MLSNKAKYLVIGLIAVLLVTAVFSGLYMKNKYDVNDVEDIKADALTLYAKGDIEKAISNMEVYCQYVITDIEAKAVLGDWCLENGDEEKAYQYYYEASFNRVYSDEKIPSLTVKNTKGILVEAIDDVVLEISPDVRMTKDMTLTVTGQNMVPENRQNGKITENEPHLEERDDFYTTEWFDVDPEGEFLTMSGGFNCAIWQFRDEAGIIVAAAESPNKYRVKNTPSINIYQMARVAIPKEAVQCRVTYLDMREADITASLDEELTIVYGRLPGVSKKARIINYSIPDLKEGEKVIYSEDTGWLLLDENGARSLEWELPDIERGSNFSISGTLPGKVSFAKSTYSDYSKDGIYTIRFDAATSSAMGERMDDAKNLGFNSTVGHTTITLGENHFDNIYPWKDIKLCAVKDGKVVYSGEMGFNTIGDAGDVFVEIPKFYVRREIGPRYDLISISGVKHEGFEVDPAFLTENGETDKIYVAAYMTARDDEGNLASISDKVPVLNMTPEDIKRQTEMKGEGYREIDYAAINAVQKLFMVETGLRNSQYLYTGICAYTVDAQEGEGAVSALETRDNTNCIDISANPGFIEGNSIIIYDCENYSESYKKALDDIREINVIIDNNDGTYSVYFTGESIDVKEGRTAIAHVALENGRARSVEGSTGAISTARGTVSFKYRHIENLWGNAYVYLDNVSVKGSKATITDRRGNSFELEYALPVTNSDNPTECVIRKLGFDTKHPFILFPSEAGSRATMSTYFGDTYMNGNDENDYVLHFGGARDSEASAGLFSYAAVAQKDECYPNTTGRMMYFK